MATVKQELCSSWLAIHGRILNLGRQILVLQQEQDKARTKLFSADYELRAMGIDPVDLLVESFNAPQPDDAEPTGAQP